MKRIVALVLLGICGTALQAAPLAFTDTLYLTDSFASVGAASDTKSDSNPPTAFPLLTIAAVDADTASASAAGSADLGFLGSAASASSTVDPASALASSEFIGSFVAPVGAIRLSLNFDTLNNGSDGTDCRKLDSIDVDRGRRNVPERGVQHRPIHRPAHRLADRRAGDA